VVSQRMTVACILPAVAGNLECPADATGSKDDGFRSKHLEAPSFPFIPESAGNTVSVFQQGNDGTFHVDFNTLVNAVVLKGADHFQPGTVAYMRQPWISMPTEIPLKNPPVFGAIK